MATETTPSNLPARGAHAREEVGNERQATLTQRIDLALFGKQLHWTVVGRDFRSLHLQLDELIDSWLDLSDTVAERSVAIGHFPDGQAATVATASEIAPVERGPIEDVEVVRVLTHRLVEITERLRGRMDGLGELDLA